MSAARRGLRLLLVNFAMDRRDPVLAWQASVARELARRSERVVALTEREGDLEAEPNLEVVVVPRAFCRLPLRPLGAKWLAGARIGAACRREGFDACFVHMNHEWVARLWPWLRASGVPILLWYAHGSVSRRLRLSHRLADRIVTSSPEGFRIPSEKVEVIGQAIDTALFSLREAPTRREEIVYVGRVAPRKRIELLIEVLAALGRLRPEAPLRLRVVGPTLPRDRGYEASLRRRAEDLGVAGRLELAGPVDREAIPALYGHAFLHLNVSRTGSMDKTVLEALACGCPVLTSNEAYAELLRPYPSLWIPDDRPEAIARQVLALRDGGAPPREALRALVEGRNDLRTWTASVLRILEQIARGERHAGRESLAIAS